MSSAGHVMDMIQRLNNNRNLQLERHSRYAKVKKAYQKSEIKHTLLAKKKELSPAEIADVRFKIRRDIQKAHLKTLILTTIFAPIAIIITFFLIWYAIGNFN